MMPGPHKRPGSVVGFSSLTFAILLFAILAAGSPAKADVLIEQPGGTLEIKDGCVAVTTSGQSPSEEQILKVGECEGGGEKGIENGSATENPEPTESSENQGNQEEPATTTESVERESTERESTENGPTVLRPGTTTAGEARPAGETSRGRGTTSETLEAEPNPESSGQHSGRQRAEELLSDVLNACVEQSSSGAQYENQDSPEPTAEKLTEEQCEALSAAITTPGEEEHQTPEPDTEPDAEPDAEPAQSGASCPASPASDESVATYETVVERVVDGDTVEISPAVEGTDRVRLIGVDTPETFDPETGESSSEPEPFGPEASAFTEEELAGRPVTLELDEEAKDDYGRLLAYVWTEDDSGLSMFNRTLLREGYGELLLIEPNTRYGECLTDAEQTAADEQRGLWSDEAETATKSSKPVEQEPVEQEPVEQEPVEQEPVEQEPASEPSEQPQQEPREEPTEKPEAQQAPEVQVFGGPSEEVTGPEPAPESEPEPDPDIEVEPESEAQTEVLPAPAVDLPASQTPEGEEVEVLPETGGVFYSPPAIFGLVFGVTMIVGGIIVFIATYINPRLSSDPASKDTEG